MLHCSTGGAFLIILILTTEYFIIKVSYVSTINCLWNLSHKYIILMVHWPFVLHLSRKWSGKQYCLLVIAMYQYLFDFSIKCEVYTANNCRQQQGVTIVQWIYYVWTGLIQHVVTFQHLLIYYIMSRNHCYLKVLYQAYTKTS